MPSRAAAPDRVASLVPVRAGAGPRSRTRRAGCPRRPDGPPRRAGPAHGHRGDGAGQPRARSSPTSPSPARRSTWSRSSPGRTVRSTDRPLLLRLVAERPGARGGVAAGPARAGGRPGQRRRDRRPHRPRAAAARRLDDGAHADRGGRPGRRPRRRRRRHGRPRREARVTAMLELIAQKGQRAVPRRPRRAAGAGRAGPAAALGLPARPAGPQGAGPARRPRPRAARRGPARSAPGAVRATAPRSAATPTTGEPQPHGTFHRGVSREAVSRRR